MRNKIEEVKISKTCKCGIKTDAQNGVCAVCSCKVVKIYQDMREDPFFDRFPTPYQGKVA